MHAPPMALRHNEILAPVALRHGAAAGWIHKMLSPCAAAAADCYRCSDERFDGEGRERGFSAVLYPQPGSKGVVAWVSFERGGDGGRKLVLRCGPATLASFALDSLLLSRHPVSRSTVRLALRSSQDCSIWLQLEDDCRLEAFGAALGAECLADAELQRAATCGGAQPHADSSHLGSLQMLVDTASRMSQVPDVHAGVKAACAGEENARPGHSVTLPPLHDVLAELSDIRTRPGWSSVEATTSSSAEQHPQAGGRWCSPAPNAAPSQRYSPLSATRKTGEKPQKARRNSAIPSWPAQASELRRGVNDTWNSFQCANKGRSVSTAEWKDARARLWAEHDEWIGGISEVSSCADRD
eukprot:Tamp_17361.p1 GENE.Tamp_17361~~Tamp_17361.p1  ORF type:complete len:354 (+),score=65.51 Tamp_17361:1-1062(+)